MPPFNGSGTFTLPGAALSDGQTVSAAEHNTLRNDLATALSDCVTRDGQSPATANLPMGGFKLTGLAAGSGNGESVRYEQLTAALVEIQPISASVAANALTISASALSLDFRSATLGSGTVTNVSGTPSNLVISSGSTLGTTSAVKSRIAILALNNAGTIELAAVNIAGGNDLTETGLITTTAEGGAGGADSASTVYSTTARTNVAYRVIGYIESTQATAGTWATAPSTIQGAGGNALTAMSSLGYGQTWQDLTGSRAYSTTYYNTTGRPIVIQVNSDTISDNTFIIDGVSFSYFGYVNLVGIVPPNSSYSVTTNVGTLRAWSELR